MSVNNQADPQDGEQAAEESRDPGKGKVLGPKKKSSGRPADVGRALRSVYDDTLREDIPADLRDLLGRLG